MSTFHPQTFNLKMDPNLNDTRTVSEVFKQYKIDPSKDTVALAMDGTGERWGIPYQQYKDTPFGEAIKKVAEGEAAKRGETVAFSSPFNKDTFIHHWEIIPIKRCHNFLKSKSEDGSSSAPSQPGQGFGRA